MASIADTANQAVRESCLSPRGPTQGIVFVLSGPSGVGKDTVTRGLKESGFPLNFCVTATTRDRRPGEIHEVSYYFLSEHEFDEWLASGEFLEHAVVHGKRYGIPREGIRAGLRSGRDVLVTPDVQGAATLREEIPQAITIFLEPPSLNDLYKRLIGRGTEDPDELRRRLHNAEIEMGRKHEFEYVVRNEQGRLYETMEQIKAIVTAERCRVVKRIATL